MPNDPTDLDIMDAATDEFARLLGAVTDLDWARPTPCEEWHVAELVDHVIGAARIYAALIQGQPFNDAMTAGKVTQAVDQDRQVCFRSDTTQLRDALDLEGVWAMDFDVPGGPVTGAGLATVRIFDVTVHCWDLARSIGAPEAFPEAILRHAWKYARQHYGTAEADRASQEAEHDQHPQPLLAGLIVLTGRSMQWRSPSTIASNL